jgi:hypothetical protein
MVWYDDAVQIPYNVTTMNTVVAHNDNHPIVVVVLANRWEIYAMILFIQRGICLLIDDVFACSWTADGGDIKTASSVTITINAKSGGHNQCKTRYKQINGINTCNLVDLT